MTNWGEFADRSERPGRVEGPEVEPVDGEQVIRDRAGYSASETRTKAERDQAAARIMEKAGPVVPLEFIPRDRSVGQPNPKPEPKKRDRG